MQETDGKRKKNKWKRKTDNGKKGKGKRKEKKGEKKKRREQNLREGGTGAFRKANVSGRHYANYSYLDGGDSS